MKVFNYICLKGAKSETFAQREQKDLVVLRTLCRAGNKVALDNSKATKIVRAITNSSKTQAYKIAKNMQIAKISTMLSNGIKNLAAKIAENAATAGTKKKVDDYKKKTDL